MSFGIGRLEAVNVVFAEIPDVGGSLGVTSIDKRSISTQVSVTSAGVSGDQRSDMEHHGSTDQAVYAYSVEDYDWWRNQIDVPLRAGIFGENLTTIDVPVSLAVVGSIWRIGSAELQVTSPRIPCGTFTRWMKLDYWVKTFTQSGRPGAYLRVIKEGQFDMHDSIEVTHVPSHGVTIADVFAVLSGDRTEARLLAVANCPDLPQDKRDKVSKFLS